MMRLLGKILSGIILAMNAMAALLLLLSAYSSHLNPQSFPVVSCMGLAFPVFLFVNILFLCFWWVVYRKYLFFPLLALMGCWGAIRSYCPIHLWPEDAPEKAIKILSYNTQAFGGRAAHTKEKPNKVLTYLQQSDADIICLQEYIMGGKLKKKDIDYALKEYPYKHYHSLANGWNGLGCYSRYPILSAKAVEYESRSNGSIAYRIKVGEDTLLVINNHLESNKIGDSEVETYQGVIETLGDEKYAEGVRKLVRKLAESNSIRARQVDAVAQIMADSKEQGVVVCGDFNDSPLSYAYRTLKGNGKDAFAESGNGFGFSYTHHHLYFRLDHILLSENMQAYQCTVDDTTDASDHYPVSCYICWE